MGSDEPRDDRVTPEARAAQTPAPRVNPDLLGHERVECELRGLAEAGRLPHAILLGGPRGVGKATLAFRLARYLLATSPAFADGPSRSGLYVDPGSNVFRRVASGGHADLLTIGRAYDPRRRRLRSEIIVEDTREITGFFRLTAAEEGWRIVVVDGAEAMNRHAANALLKTLEEPPRRALLLLVSHNPGQLPPTIRSRCRRIAVMPLPRPLIIRLLDRYRPELAKPEPETLAELAEGSIGRALELADADGIALYRSLLTRLSQVPRLNVAELHAFADQLARPEAEDVYRTVQELLSQFLARMIAHTSRGELGERDLIAEEAGVMRRLAACAHPEGWVRLREAIDRSFVDTDQLNLDRKQAVLGAFFAIEEIAR